MARETFRKIITSKELDKQINPENWKLAERFLKDKGRNTSPLTIKNYYSDLRIFFTYLLLHVNNKFFTDIKKLEYSDFFSFCTDVLRWGSSRQNRVRSTISSLSDFIVKFYDDEYPQFRNIVKDVIDSAPKSLRREKTVLTDEDVENLIEELKRDNIQQCLWLTLSVASGARFSEVLRIKKETIEKSKEVFDGIFLQTPPVKTKGRGKEGRMQEKFIIKDMFIETYNKWIAERDVIVEDAGLEHDSIFISRDGSPATQGTVRSWVKSIEERLGKDLYPHALRHFTVSYLTRKMIPQPLIVFLMGWKTSQMYEIYNDVDPTSMSWSELENLK